MFLAYLALKRLGQSQFFAHLLYGHLVGYCLQSEKLRTRAVTKQYRLSLVRLVFAFDQIIQRGIKAVFPESKNLSVLITPTILFLPLFILDPVWIDLVFIGLGSLGLYLVQRLAQWIVQLRSV